MVIIGIVGIAVLTAAVGLCGIEWLCYPVETPIDMRDGKTKVIPPSE